MKDTIRVDINSNERIHVRALVTDIKPANESVDTSVNEKVHECVDASLCTTDIDISVPCAVIDSNTDSHANEYSSADTAVDISVSIPSHRESSPLPSADVALTKFELNANTNSNSDGGMSATATSRNVSILSLRNNTLSTATIATELKSAIATDKLHCTPAASITILHTHTHSKNKFFVLCDSTLFAWCSRGRYKVPFI